ncbi:MAG: hypothetical protein LBK98_07530 [Peptococcaceae bacterium]|jgi:multicomponent Na+:H+ antiporter subunit B|nr:hypothetical protein [Peptococcaceae bacterium]
MNRLNDGERGIFRRFQAGYGAIGLLVSGALAAVLLLTVSYLPGFGQADRPTENEVSQRYIAKGLEETGATNVVAAVILDYRAFDTLGESAVLFAALAAVILLLREEPAALARRMAERKPFEPDQGPILRITARVLIPWLLLFGAYLVLNGHLSPGGGFSGGAVTGAAMILHNLAFGPEQTRRFLSERIFFRLLVGALCFYGLAKGYVFFTGGNHLPGSIPLGQAGSIFSGGLIGPLNIAVGIVTACAVYGIFALFDRGGW